MRPSEDTAEQIAAALRFPLEFFSAPDLEEVAADAASFRALTKMTAGQREAAFASGVLAFALHDWIEERFALPADAIPRLSASTNPETAAAIVRSEWGVGSKPIGRLIPLLEMHGVRVYSLAEDCAEVDAFSMWRKGNGFVFLNQNKTAEHSRFDAAHELAHLVLHGGEDVPHGKEAEQQANAFAGAFLMPRDRVLATVPRRASARDLARVKKPLKVSVSALAYRGRELGIFTDWHFRKLCVEISQLGWRTSEPEPIQRERSQVLDKVFSALREDGIGKRDIARELALEPHDLEKLVFGLTLLPVTGEASVAARNASRPEVAGRPAFEVYDGGAA